jgi:hypothetical protein
MNSVTAQAAELKLALEQLYKQAEEAPAKEKPKYSYKPKGPAKDKDEDDNAILTDSLGARAFDWTHSPWNAARAGKATTLAKAMGQKVDPTISHPKSTSFMHNLTGMGIGALGGAGIGAGLGALSNGPDGGASGGAILGGLGGAGAGLLGAIIRDGVVRTKGINRIRNDYNAAREAGTPMDLNAANPDLSRWGSLLFAGGNHRSGSVDALEQLAGRNAHSNVVRGTGRLASALKLPFAEEVSGLGEGYGAAVRNQKLISELEKGASDDLKDYDDLTDDVPSEFKGAHGEMRKFISDTNKKKDKKVDKSAAFAARLGHQNGTMHKRAFLESLKGMGTQALNAYKGLDPTAQAAILGGGAGAAIGGVGNAMFGNKKKGLLSRLGMGALAGGGVGALGGAGVNEAAIRLGMNSLGANDRKTYLGQDYSSSPSYISPPVDTANDLIGKGYNKYLKPSKPADKG